MTTDHVKARGASPTGAPSVPALAPPPVVSIAYSITPALVGLAGGLLYVAMLEWIPQHGGESQRNAPAATIPTENSPPVADDVAEKIRIERNRVVDDAWLRDTNGETLQEYLVRKRTVAP